LLSWLERRARLVELADQRPHNALMLISAVQAIETSLTDASLVANAPVTPLHQVESLLLLSYFKKQFPESSAFLLLTQLKDLVYLWVSFILIFFKKKKTYKMVGATSVPIIFGSFFSNDSWTYRYRVTRPHFCP
jgi:hypothetical protein